MVSVQLPVSIPPPKVGTVLACPFMVTADRSMALAGVKVCPGGPALSVKSPEPFKPAAEKSGCEIAALGGAELLVVIRAAPAGPAHAQSARTMAATANRD